MQAEGESWRGGGGGSEEGKGAAKEEGRLIMSWGLGKDSEHCKPHFSSGDPCQETLAGSVVFLRELIGR